MRRRLLGVLYFARIGAMLAAIPIVGAIGVWRLCRQVKARFGDALAAPDRFRSRANRSVRKLSPDTRFRRGRLRRRTDLAV